MTANQIYFWGKEGKLCCCRQLCYRTAPWCPRVYALSAPCTQIRGFFFYRVLLFIATPSNISQPDRLTLGHFIWMKWDFKGSTRRTFSFILFFFLMFLVSGRNSRKAIKRDKGYMQWIERGKTEKKNAGKQARSSLETELWLGSIRVSPALCPL